MNVRGTYNQKLQQWLKKSIELCEKTKGRIRWLAANKSIISKSDIKRYETALQESIQFLEKEIKKFPNIDLANKFMELKVMWQEYMIGMEIKSDKEENEEAEKMINDIMRQYNEEHYGKSGRK